MCICVLTDVHVHVHGCTCTCMCCIYMYLFTLVALKLFQMRLNPHVHVHVLHSEQFVCLVIYMYFTLLWFGRKGSFRYSLIHAFDDSQIVNLTQLHVVFLN